MVVMYVVIGCVLGFLEFTVAKALFRHDPRRATLLTRQQFIKCLLLNAIAWPGILMWLAMLGLLKGIMRYQEKKR